MRPIIHTFGTWKMPSNAEDAHMCLYTLRLKTWAIEPKEFWTLLQQLLAVSTLLRPSVFFAFYDGGEWEMVGRACTCMCVITQTSIYYIIQCRERQPLKTQNYFVWGYFKKKKAKMHYFSFACFEMGADGDNCIPSSNEVKLFESCKLEVSSVAQKSLFLMNVLLINFKSLLNFSWYDGRHGNMDIFYWFQNIWITGDL